MSHEGTVTVRNLRTLAFWGLAAYLVYRLVQSMAAAILIFSLALFLAVALDGPIRYLDRRGLSRGMSVAIIVIGLLITVSAGVAVSVKPVARQVHEITDAAPSYVRAIERRIEAFTGRYPYLEGRLDNGDLGRWLSNAGQRAFSQVGRFSVGVVGTLLTGLIVLVTALYAVLDPKPLVRGLVMAAPRAYRRVVLRCVVRIAQQVQAWVVATLWLMAIVGVACGVGLWAIGVKSALLFGILAGIGEAIPTIGPILTAIPPALVAFADEPTKALWVLGLFLVVQQLESHLLVPRVMAAALKLHPVSILFFVVALGSILGPLGVLLATPLCAAAKVAYRELRADAERRAARQQARSEGQLSGEPGGPT